MSVKKIKRVLNIADKVLKPISSTLAIALDEHRIGWLARIPREIVEAIKEIEKEE